MLKKFTYIKPKTIKEALYNLKNDVLPLAGGSDLLVRIRAKICNPKSIIDISEISELREIYEDPKELFIGGAVTFSELIEFNIIGNYLFILKQAAQTVGSPQIRNIGTIAGNVQSASPAGDGLVALFGLEAKVNLISANNERTLPIKEFVIGPNKTDKKPNELIKGFTIFKKNWDYQKFFKIGKRNALAISIVNGVVKLNIDENKKITDACIILGAVASTPIRLKSAEELLVGNTYTSKLAYEFRETIKKSISPISDIRASKEYRRYIASVMCERIVSNSMNRGDYK